MELKNKNMTARPSLSRRLSLGQGLNLFFLHIIKAHDEIRKVEFPYFAHPMHVGHVCVLHFCCCGKKKSGKVLNVWRAIKR